MNRIRAFPRRARAIRAGLLFITLIAALLPRGADAASAGVVSGTGGDGVWLKAGPHASTARIALLAEGTAVTVLEGPVNADDGYAWLRVTANGQGGWVVRDYIKLSASAPPGAGLAPGSYARVAGVAAYGGLKLRAGPAPWEAQLAAIPEGAIVPVVDGPTIGGNGNAWYLVTHGGLRGWVDGSYLTPSAPPAPAPVAGLAPGATAIVTGAGAHGGLRLRAAPGPGEAVLDLLPEGTRLRILEGPAVGGDGGLWCRVAWGDSWGWVSALYLQPAVGAAPPPSPAAAAFIQAALDQLGKPYVWGAAGPDGFDCSGLTLYAARKALGITLTRTADGQAWAGVHVDLADLRPGDMVFYENTYAAGITHVGIYIGNNQFVSAANETSGVAISSLDEPYWKSRYAGARRIT